MIGRSLSFRVFNLFFLMAAATCGFAQGGSLQQQVTALQTRVAAAEAALRALRTALTTRLMREHKPMRNFKRL
jgi:hypothetical protein